MHARAQEKEKERETVRVCVCVSERETHTTWMAARSALGSQCVGVFVCERAGSRMHACRNERERARVCVFVCV